MRHFVRDSISSIQEGDKMNSMKRVLAFLRELRENNNTVWFHAHRAEYEEVRSYFNDFAVRLIAKVQEFDASVAGLELKDCTYRINRDIRFSSDKSPYKTHMGVFICPGGKKSGKAGYYIHVSPEGEGGGGYPDGCMLAIGNYCYDKKVVEIVREDIEDDGAFFDGMIQNAKQKGYQLDCEDSLKRVPRGFNADSPYAEYLKLKSYCLSKRVSEEFVCAESLMENVVEEFRSQKSFNDYLNKVADYVEEVDE